MKLQVLYFAWLRERIGEGREIVETDATTVADLIEELRGREPRYAAAFADITTVRVALDQEMVSLDAPLENAREVAFFPPMTGG
jgi:molybdopterin synthase sulfur carrier subunit